jgi:hypothetical protein
MDVDKKETPLAGRLGPEGRALGRVVVLNLFVLFIYGLDAAPARAGILCNHGERAVMLVPSSTTRTVERRVVRREVVVEEPDEPDDRDATASPQSEREADLPPAKSLPKRDAAAPAKALPRATPQSRAAAPATRTIVREIVREVPVTREVVREVPVTREVVRVVPAHCNLFRRTAVVPVERVATVRDVDPADTVAVPVVVRRCWILGD